MRHSPIRTRATGLCFGAGLAAVALAGCSSAGTTSASAQSTGSTAFAAGATTTTTTPAATGSTTTTAAAGGDNGAGSGSGQTGSGTSSDACTTSDLSLQVLEGPQNGSDRVGVYLVLTNTSHSTCTTYGYPGVDFYLGTKDLHEQSTRTTTGSGSPTTVTLAPDGQATSYFTYPSGSVCDATADTVQVIAPNQTTALRASIGYVGGATGSKQFDVCDGNIDVGPLQAGYDGPH